MVERNPQHVGFIMDGNRRWAKERGLSTLEGHSEGANRIEPIVNTSIERSIPNLTFYTFSTENWNRSEMEIAGLMDVFRAMLYDESISRLNNQGVRVNMMGAYQKFPEDIVQRIDEIHNETSTESRVTVNFALNYGGDEEIVQAANKAISENQGQLLTKDLLSKYMYTSGQPDLDLVIRTGGEQRISNFMLWQIKYAELYFTNVYWPDFTPEQYNEALQWFQERQRRFGK
jgi:undecaprenyl diphosphate synthase